MVRRTGIFVSASIVVLACADTTPTDNPDPGPDPNPITRVDVSSPGGSMLIGDTTRLAASVFAKDGSPVANANVIWSSSDERVAVVDDAGLVTAADSGTAQVTAESGAVSGDATITVDPAARVPVTVDQTLPQQALGEIQTLVSARGEAGAGGSESLPLSVAADPQLVMALNEDGDPMLGAFGTHEQIGEIGVASTASTLALLLSAGVDDGLRASLLQEAESTDGWAPLLASIDGVLAEGASPFLDQGTILAAATVAGEALERARTAAAGPPNALPCNFADVKHFFFGGRLIFGDNAWVEAPGTGGVIEVYNESQTHFVASTSDQEGTPLESSVPIGPIGWHVFEGCLFLQNLPVGNAFVVPDEGFKVRLHQTGGSRLDNVAALVTLAVDAFVVWLDLPSTCNAQEVIASHLTTVLAGIAAAGNRRDALDAMEDAFHDDLFGSVIVDGLVARCGAELTVAVLRKLGVAIAKTLTGFLKALDFIEDAATGAELARVSYQTFEHWNTDVTLSLCFVDGVLTKACDPRVGSIRVTTTTNPDPPPNPPLNHFILHVASDPWPIGFTDQAGVPFLELPVGSVEVGISGVSLPETCTVVNGSNPRQVQVVEDQEIPVHFDVKCDEVLVAVPPALDPSAVGVALDVELDATGGTGEYAWTLLEGPLPPGVTLLGNRVSGVLTVAGSYPVVLEVSSGDQKVPLPLTLEIGQCLPSATILDPAGVEAKSGVHCVDGDVTIRDLGAPAVVNFPNLATVGGNLAVIFNPGLSLLNLPALQSIGGRFDLSSNGVLQEAVLPALASIGGQLAVGGNDALTRVAAPKLGGAIEFLHVGGNGRLGSVDLGKLQTITNGVWIADNGTAGGVAGPFSMPLVTFVDHINFFRNGAFDSFDMPRLQSMIQGLHILDNQNLTSVDFQDFDNAKWVAINNNPNLDAFALPSLRSVTEGFGIGGNDALSTISLGSLQTVGHGFGIGANASLSSFSAPLLESTGHGLHIHENQNLTSVDFSRFSTADWITIQSNASLPTLAFPSLASVTGTVVIGPNQGLASITALGGTLGGLNVSVNPELIDLSFVGLQQVLGGVHINGNGTGAGVQPSSIDFPHLTSVGSTFTISGNPVLSSVSAGQLAGAIEFLHVGGNERLGSVDLGSLQTITNGVWIADNGTAGGVPGPFSMPLVTFVDHINFFRNGAFDSFDMPRLQSMIQGLHILDNQNLTSVDFQDFDNAKWVAINNNPNLDAFSLPSLRSVTEGFGIGGNDALSTVSLGSLQTVGHGFGVGPNAALASISAPLLQSTGHGLHVADNPSLTSVDFGSFASADWVSFNNNTALPSLSLPALQSTGAHVSVTGNSGLLSASFTALQIVGAGLDVSGNAGLSSFSVPSLFSVGGLSFNNNPSYCASAVDAIATQVGLAPGTYANNGNAGCLAAFREPLGQARR